VYGRRPSEHKPEFSQITEASNENETDPETSRNEAYQNVMIIKFDSYKLNEFQTLELQLQDFCANLLIFLRCELAARAYFSMREFARVNFTSSQFMANSKDAIKPESSITSLLSDYRKIFNLLSNYTSSKQISQSNFQLRSDWIYWVYSQTYVLCLKLYEKFIRFLRVKRVDETGLERLKVTLQVIDADF